MNYIQQNRSTVNATPIPDTVIAEAIDKMQEAMALLRPYSTTLSTEQRMKLPKVGDKTYAFVQKGITYCNSQPEFLPGYFDLAEWTIEFENFKALYPACMAATELLTLITDTKISCGNNAYMPALGYYDAVKMAMKNGVLGAKVIYKDMSARFAGRKKKAKPKPPAAANNIAAAEAVKAA